MRPPPYDKIKNGDKLTSKDYEEMVDYMYDAMLEVEELNREGVGCDQATIMEAGREIASVYPYFNEYFKACMNASDSNDPEIVDSNVDQQKWARVIHCVVRGWGMFW